jgi:glutamine phosphoribosylpyrophosphate amidotransferase
LSLEGLLRACGDPFGNRHCTACYTNDYPIQVTSDARTKTEREEGALLHDSVWPRA